MVFDEIVGQANTVKSIKNAVANDRTAHAYLFSGPDGVGKSTAASILACALNCRVSKVDPCGTCPSCIRASAGSHPDIIHVRVNRSSISVSDIRDLQKDMQKMPYEKGVKAYIIHEADKMTEQAQNALLKTLEEPPSHVVIILLARNHHGMLGTIISRCQVLKFSRAPEKDIEEYLRMKKGVGADEARYTAAFSDGILGRALEFLENEEFKRARNEVIEMAGGIYKGDKIHVLSYADYFNNNKDRIDNILEIMMSWFRDILVYKECRDDRYLINLDKAGIIAQECPRYTCTVLNNIIDSIMETSNNIKTNVNFQLSIENMLLDIQEG